MANRFWVGGTGTWDSTSTTHWAATTGGASGASAPIAGDNVTFDGSSGGGTVTPDGTIAGVAFANLTAGAFTGTLAFNTNNPNMTVSGVVTLSGTGTRTINLGSGTWTLSTTSTGTIWDLTTATNLTATFSNATIAFTGSSVNRNFLGGAQTYGAVTVSNNSSPGNFRIADASNTFASLTIGSGVCLITSSETITGALTITGTSSAPSGMYAGAPPNTITMTVGSASTLDWCGIASVTKAGAGSITATNSLDMGRNSGITISVPSGGGSVTGVIGS